MSTNGGTWKQNSTFFACRSRAFENIPPTQATLKQHILRTAYKGEITLLGGNHYKKNPYNQVLQSGDCTKVVVFP
jgi:hypothetical protein